MATCTTSRHAYEDLSVRCRLIGKVELWEDPELRDFTTRHESCDTSLESAEEVAYEMSPNGRFDVWDVACCESPPNRSVGPRKGRVTLIARRLLHCRALVPALCNTSSIDHIIIWKSGIDDDDAFELGRALASGTCRIRSLHLPRNYITSIGARYLSLGLGSRCHLRTLDLSDNVVCCPRVPC